MILASLGLRQIMTDPRRRSRISNTIIYRDQRSISSSASTTEKGVLTSSQPVAESTDEDSALSHLAFDRSARGFCRNCGSSVGDFFNSWYKVTGSYYIPALLGSYKSLLIHNGKPKSASDGTDLEGCTIQPLSCPTPNCIDPPLGFNVIETPAGKEIFRGRDLFKLMCIELQCKLSTGEIIVVDPKEDGTTDSIAIDNLESPSPEPAKIPRLIQSIPYTEGIETDKPPLESQHLTYHLSRHEQYHGSAHQDPLLQHAESDAQSPSPPNSLPACPGMVASPGITQNVQSKQLPINSNANRPMHDMQRHTVVTMNTPAKVHPGIASDPPPVLSQLQSTHESGRFNGHHNPRSPRIIELDAVGRLQIQISQNSGALAAHTRDIRRGEETFRQLEESLRHEFQDQLFRQSGEIQRMDDALVRLHREIQGMHQAMEGLRHEVYMSRVDTQSQVSNMSPAQSISAQDSALELMARQIALASQKANEVDALKVTIEIMRNKIQRLEEGPRHLTSQSDSYLYQSPRAQVVPSSQLANSVAPPFTSPPVVPQVSSSVQSPASAHSNHALSVSTSATQPAISQQHGLLSEQTTGWSSINTGVKRAHANTTESPHNAATYVYSSPKRPRLVTESRNSSTNSQEYISNSQSAPEVGQTESRVQAIPHLASVQRLAIDPNFDSQPQRSFDVPLGTQVGLSDDTWQPASHRIVEHRTRGRPRGGGMGSRGGRSRKNIPANFQPLGTPEWEKEEWQGVSASQTGPHGYHNHDIHSGRGIARRGSGGGGTRGGYAPSDRALSLGLQSASGSIGFDSLNDPYALARKTRTKPIRNAEGVLIRKDGRPDMRSQSSAANLRKVHARKEGDSTHSPFKLTPTNLNGHDTPSSDGLEATPSVYRKHSVIMDRIFPNGLHESRKQHDYAHHIFNENLDRTVLPNAQIRQSGKAASIQIKEELQEQHGSTGAQRNQIEDVTVNVT